MHLLASRAPACMCLQHHSGRIVGQLEAIVVGGYHCAELRRAVRDSRALVCGHSELGV